MEACGSAHHWARWLSGLGIEARLLPAAYVRACVKCNKTDAAGACSLLEAPRCADIEPVRINSVEQQAQQGLRRIRSLWMSARASRINALRGFCREFGLALPRSMMLLIDQSACWKSASPIWGGGSRRRPRKARLARSCYRFRESVS